jgi:hypothetical protein
MHHIPGMKSLRFIAIILFFSLSALSADVGKRLPMAESVSLMRILSNPQNFVGKQIRVGGTLSWGFEDEKLFLTSDHFIMYDEASSVEIRLDIPNSGLQYSDIAAYHGCLVKLEGVISLVNPRAEDIEVARKGGIALIPKYILVFTRLLSYGQASTIPAEQGR